MKLSLEARRALKGNRRSGELPAMSRVEFAELTGVSDSLIAKRDNRTQPLTKTAIALYEMILDLHDDSPRNMEAVQDVLASVPKESRNEDKSLAALTSYCVDSNKRHLVRWALGDEEAEPEEVKGVTDMVAANLRTLARAENSLRFTARGVEGEDARVLREIAADLASIQERLEMFSEAQRDRVKKPPDEELSPP